MNLPSISTNKSFTGLDFGKAQTVFAPVGAVIVSLAVLAFVVWPKFNQALSIRTENEQLVSRISLLSDKVKILESLDKTVLDRQVISSERLLPSDKATFAFVRQIETIASTSGTVLNKVEVAPVLLLKVVRQLRRLVLDRLLTKQLFLQLAMRYKKRLQAYM